MGTVSKKYGLLTTTAMVTGIVIGSGVFFKADDVLNASGGSLLGSLTAWLIGGLIMVVSAYTFSLFARRVEKSNGVVDYIEEAYGQEAAYYVAIFMGWVYYPVLAGVLAWVSGLYSATLFNLDGYALWYFAIFYYLLFNALNYYSPKLAGQWQVSATVIKLIPISLIAVVGIIAGLINGVTMENFQTSAVVVGGGSAGLATAVLATSFAYDGWITATSINAEIIDAKKTLPKALILGTLVVISAYMLYYLGLSGVLSNQVFVDQGDNAVYLAAQTLFGSAAGTLLLVFVVISCLGTLNGLTLGASRGMYSIAIRNRGYKPALFTAVDTPDSAPKASVLAGFVIGALWLVVWFGNFEGWWGGFMDTSELPIALQYGIFIGVYVYIIRSFKEETLFNRFIAPSLATAGSLYIVYAAVQKDLFLVFMGLMVVIAVIAYFFDKSYQQA